MSNQECRGHLFVIVQNGQLVEAYPPVRVDFDPQNLPERILRTFEEAISCHSSGLYIAAAIMVRRTLEEVCADRAAQGKNLKERIADRVLFWRLSGLHLDMSQETAFLPCHRIDIGSATICFRMVGRAKKDFFRQPSYMACQSA
jgi:hypothetical protein